MKVICPKCQFENQADSSRVVCARCATIIEIKPDQAAGLEANGKRQTARLPFVGNVGNSQPLTAPPSPPNRDVYATRIGDEFDDVLDIPRQTQPTAQPGHEPATKFEDVFAMPSYGAPSASSSASASSDYQSQEKKPTAPVEGFPTGASTRQRSTQDYDDAPEQEFMGWPVLPENGDYEQDQAGGFSNNRGATLLRIAVGVVVFGVLSALAYYLLADKINKRSNAFNDRIADNNPSASPTYPPVTAVTAPNPANATAAKPAATIPPTEITNQPNQTLNQASGQQGNAKPVEIAPMTGKSGHSSTPKPPPAETAQATTTPNHGSLTIQVASFNDQNVANERINWFRSKGVEARSVKVEIPGKGTWYRVQIGGFKTREEASSFASQLKSKGVLQDFIITTIGK